MTTADAFADARARFRALHQSGCFVIPNPWDAGTARWLAGLGFQALASTSSGFAFAAGRPDGGMPLDAVLAHFGALAGATPLPVNADFENGHAADLDGLSGNVTLCVATGVAGLSIEDSTGDAARQVFSLADSVARIKAARRAIDATGTGVMLVARAEAYFHAPGQALPEAISRLTAFADAGADCLFAPGITSRDGIAALVKAVAPKPLNVLIGDPSALTVADLAALGVRRVSVGGGLAGAAWGAFDRAARALAAGRFDGFAGNLSHDTLDAFFRR